MQPQRRSRPAPPTASPIASSTSIRRSPTINHEVWDQPRRRLQQHHPVRPLAARPLLLHSCRRAQPPVTVTITATVKYRRFNQHFIDFGMSMPASQHYEQPITDMVSASRTIAPGENKPRQSARQPAENTRSGCAGTTMASPCSTPSSTPPPSHAFERVAKLRPDYADIFTNIGHRRYPVGEVRRRPPQPGKGPQASPPATPARCTTVLSYERNLGNRWT